MFRYFVAVLLLVNSSYALSENYNFSFGDLLKIGSKAVQKKVEQTPLEVALEANAEVDKKGWRNSEEFVTQDSVLFKGFSAIYAPNPMISSILPDPYLMVYLTKTDGDVPVVLNLTDLRMYIKRNGDWSLGSKDDIKKYFRESLFPSINRDVLVNKGPKEESRVLMVYGTGCAFSQGAESLLEHNKTPHSIWVSGIDDNKPYALDLMCGDAATWSGWTKGKKAPSRECVEREKYKTANNEFYEIFMLLGYREFNWPIFIDNDGAITMRPGNNGQVASKVNSYK